jgi:hypothetical protein
MSAQELSQKALLSPPFFIFIRPRNMQKPLNVDLVQKMLGRLIAEQFIEYLDSNNPQSSLSLSGID